MDVTTFLLLVIPSSSVILLVLIAVVGKRIVKALGPAPESQAHRKDLGNFVIGILGWPALNAVVIYFSHRTIQANICEGALLRGGGGFGCSLSALALEIFVVALINIVILAVLLIKRRWWVVLGMLACAAISGILFSLNLYFRMW